MAINAEKLNEDFKEFEVDGTVKTVEDADLDHWWHGSQEDSFGGESSTNVKGFFDFIPRRVFLPWLNTITNVLNALKSTVTKNKTDGDEALNAFEKTVETEYLKSERVQQKYDPESAEPLSGKAVREAVELEGVDTVWEGFRKIGGYLEARGDQFWHMSLVNDILRKVQSGDFESNVEGWSGNVKIFVRNLATDQIYFISGSEVMKVMMGSLEAPAPVFDLADFRQKTIDSLFPMMEEKEDITSQAGWFALPSDDAKVEVEYEEAPSYIYLCAADYSTEPTMYFREGATSPYLLPDDFSDQETVAKLWKAGSYLEAGPISKATLITAKEQTDREAVSPSRLQELIEAATETKTIYTQVARVGDFITITEEMKEKSLYARGRYFSSEGGYVYRDIYDTEWNIWSEMGLSFTGDGELHKVSEVDVYDVGYTIHTYFTDSSTKGDVAFYMPTEIRSVSSEKLAALLAEEVSEE